MKLPASLLAFLLSAPLIFAQELPPVVARFEQLLVRSPGKGTAFDRVYQHFFEGDGLEKLAERWQEKAKPGGAEGGTFELLLGLLAERQGKGGPALAHFKRGAELRPKDARAWQALGDAQVAAGQLGDAVKSLAEALSAGPAPDQRAALHRQLARSLARNFDTDGAVQAWRRFVAEQPDDPFVLEEAGDALTEAEQFAEAQKIFGQMLKLAGEDAFKRVTATMKLAALEERQGHTQKAVDQYEQAIPLAAETSWLHRELRARIEEIFRRQDDLPGLAAYYEKRLAAQPQDTAAMQRLADALWELNRRADAVGWLRKASAAAPGRADLSVALAKRLRDTQQPAEAVKIFERLARENPDDKAYPEWLGDAQWAVFESEKKEPSRTAAIVSWRKLAPPETKDANAIARLADLFRARGLEAEAIAEYRRAVALQPQIADARERLAEYLFERNRDEEAWRELDALATMEKPDWLRLARMQNRYGRADAALASVRRGLAAEPKSFDLLGYEWQLHAEAKRWEDALALYEPLAETAPNPYFAEDVDVRYLTALASAGKADGFRAEREPKLGTDSLGERDLRMLARVAFSAADQPLARRVIDEGARRFPQSYAMARLEVEFQKRAGDTAARVKALRRLAEIAPKQRTDWLREVVRVWQEDSKWDDALAAVRELIDAAPAAAESHVLAAEVFAAAGKPAEAQGKLREAIKLSDAPNPLRLRLAQMHQEAGEGALARAVLDQAFEAAAQPPDRLAIMQPLAAAYFVDGRLDELIERFRKRQQADAEGWRYGLYLAEIYEHAQDYVAARRELAKAYAARPNDAALLRKLLRLSQQDDDEPESVRWLAALADAEPSDANTLALIEAHLGANHGDEALALFQRHLPALKKTPGAWERLLPGFARLKLIEKIHDTLAAQADNSLETKQTLALLQLRGKEPAKAKGALWAIFALPSPPPEVAQPPSAAAQGAPPSVRVHRGHVYGLPTSKIMQRIQGVHSTRQYVQSILQPPENARANMGRYYYMQSYGAGAGTSPAPSDVDEARDFATVALAGLAAREKSAAGFLSELKKRLADRGSTRADRLVAYAHVEDHDSYANEIRLQADKPEPPEELDSVCADIVQGAAVFYQNAIYQTGPGTVQFGKDEILPLFSKLATRAAARDPAVRESIKLEEYHLRQQLGDRDGAKKLGRELIASPAGGDENKIAAQVHVAMGLGDARKMRELVPEIAAAIERNPQSDFDDMIGYLPFQALRREEGEGEDFSDQDRIALFGELIPLWLPKAPVNKNTARVSLARLRGWRAAPNFTIGEIRFFDAATVDRLVSLGQQVDQFDSENGWKVLRGAFERLEREFPEPRRIFATLARVLIESQIGDKDAATKELRALAAARTEEADDFHLLLGAILAQQDKHADALAELKQVKPRVGPANLSLQKQILQTAKAAEDRETAKQAALRLLTMRLPSDERQEIAEALRELGLADEAAKLDTQSPTVAGRGGRFDANEISSRIDKLIEAKKTDEALALARTVFARDLSKDDNGSWAVESIVRKLGQAGRLDELIAEHEKLVAAADDSVKLHFAMALLLKDGSARPAPKDKPARSAERHLRRLTDLRPDEARFARMHGEWLAEHDRHAEALPVFEKLLKRDPGAAFESGDELIESFKKANRLADLATAVLAYKPDPESSGSGLSDSHVQQVAGAFDVKKDAPLVEKLARKGLEIDRSSRNLELTRMLAKALDAQGRRDGIVKEIAEFFVPTPEKAGPAADDEPSLGFGGGESRSSYNSHSNWLSNTSYENGRQVLTALSLIDLAAEFDLEDALLTDIEARAKNNPKLPGVRELLAYVHFRQHAPGADAEVRELRQPKKADAKADPAEQMEQQMSGRYRSALWPVLAHEALSWPGKEALALELMRPLPKDEKAKTNRQPWEQEETADTAALALMMARLDDAALPATLKARTGELFPDPKDKAAQQRPTRSGREFDRAGIEAALYLMARTRLEADFAALLDKARASKHEDAKEIEPAYDEEKRNLTATPNRVETMLWLRKSEGDEAEIGWELRHEHPNDKRDIMGYLHVRGRSLPSLERERTLRIFHSRDRQQTELLGEIATKQTAGTWRGAVPAGGGWLRAVVVEKMPGGETRETPGPFVPVTRSANLIANPGFDGHAQRPARGAFDLDGWKALPAGLWRTVADAPADAGVRFVPRATKPATLAGARVAIDPAKTYTQSAWLRTIQPANERVRLGRRYLDAAGKELKVTWCPNFESLNWRSQWQKLWPADVAKTKGRRAEAIPAEAAFVEPLIEVTGGGEWAGIFLGECAGAK